MLSDISPFCRDLFLKCLNLDSLGENSILLRIVLIAFLWVQYMSKYIYTLGVQTPLNK